MYDYKLLDCNLSYILNTYMVLNTRLKVSKTTKDYGSFIPFPLFDDANSVLTKNVGKSTSNSSRGHNPP